ncbi:hypothetical protein B0H16DRAFT_1449712 [Mycena metata]|uniref:Uncharacterized protein n=1 Tax=Mycena metata TaxID=1033252 RepID=A0AAD7NUA7_9AGAR|nr:hypothetical protein B0H16DRAFT_1449712 [Mycena metata]
MTITGILEAPEICIPNARFYNSLDFTNLNSSDSHPQALRIGTLTPPTTKHRQLRPSVAAALDVLYGFPREHQVQMASPPTALLLSSEERNVSSNGVLPAQVKAKEFLRRFTRFNEIESPPGGTRGLRTNHFQFLTGVKPVESK